MENHGVLRGRPVADVAGIVQPHSYNFSGDYRGQQLDVGEFMNMVGQGVITEDAAANRGHIIPFDCAIMYISVCFIPGNSHLSLLVYLK